MIEICVPIMKSDDGSSFNQTVKFRFNEWSSTVHIIYIFILMKSLLFQVIKTAFTYLNLLRQVT